MGFWISWPEFWALYAELEEIVTTPRRSKMHAAYRAKTRRRNRR
jgi:hypothetical protein